MKISTLKSNPEKTRAWKQRSQKRLATRKPLNSRSTLETKKTMNRIGKTGKANLEANNKLRGALADQQVCEIGQLGWPEFSDCMKTWPLQNVHRHKRAWYKGNVELLSDRNQVIKGCQVCHDRIEHNAQLTELVFETLRGLEPLQHAGESNDDFFGGDVEDVY